MTQTVQVRFQKEIREWREQARVVLEQEPEAKKQ